jgi:hypothetical protein
VPKQIEGRLSGVQVLGNLDISRDDVNNYRLVDVRAWAGKRRAATRNKQRGRANLREVNYLEDPKLDIFYVKTLAEEIRLQNIFHQNFL